MYIYEIIYIKRLCKGLIPMDCNNITLQGYVLYGIDVLYLMPV